MDKPNNRLDGQLSMAAKAYEKGDFEKVKRLVVTILACDPNSAPAYRILGLVSHKKDQLNRAAEYLSKAVDLSPQQAAWHYELGLAFMDAGFHKKALKSLSSAIELDPELQDARLALGESLEKLRAFDQALHQYQLILKKKSDDPRILFYIGNVYYQQRNFEAAVKAYRKALSYDPHFFEALLNLSIALRKNGALRQAMQMCRKALRLNSNSAQAYNNAGTIQYKLGNCQDALHCYQNAISFEPNLPEAHYNMGNILKTEGSLDPAEKAYRQAISLNPDFYQALNGLGDTCRIQGRNEEAMLAYEKAIAVNPKNVAAYRNIAAIRKFSREDRFIRGMKSLINDTRLNQSERISLNFALGKAYEDLKQFDAAFEYMLEGNRLKRALFGYDRTENEVLFANIKKAFSKDFLENGRGYGVEDATPIFIMGMPRSGTSLVEQILTRHPDVYGAGELSTLDQIVTAYGKKVFKESYPAYLKQAAGNDFFKMGSIYIEKIRNQNRNTAFITDKMPQNFLFAGLIRIILPKATIIHCVRNPMDTCLSIFKNDFSRLHKYAYDLSEIGHYYRLYQDIMQHWHQHMQGFINNFQYEKMVTEPEQQVRRLLNCCGLEWHEQCLLFHESSRPVLTASTVQVRRPLYRDSIELWKNYEHQLAPLFAYLS